MKILSILLFALFLSTASDANVAPITGNSKVCKFGTDTLNDSTIGGVWSSSNIAVATVSPSMGVVTGVAAGTAIITYTVGAGYQTKTVVVNPTPSPIYGSYIICAGNTITTLYDSTAGGGTWSYIGDDELIEIISSGANYVNLLSSSSITTFDVGRLSFTDTAGCSVAAEIWAYAPPLPPITGDSIVNVGSTTILSDTEPYGIWSSSDTSVATISNPSGIATGVSSGTTTISYTEGCTATFKLTVLPPASVPVITATDAKSIGLYPNPAVTEITIQSTDQPIYKVVITNLVGQTVSSTQHNSRQVLVDVAELPAGVYFVKVNGVGGRKFVKK